MSNTISNQADVIDSRDIIERIEELQEVKDSLRDEFDSNPENDGVDFENWVCNQLDFTRENYIELEALQTLAKEAASLPYDWSYGETLIHRDYFETYMDDMIQDCYTIPELPSFISLEINYDALEQDYSSVDFDGQEYLIRSV